MPEPRNSSKCLPGSTREGLDPPGADSLAVAGAVIAGVPGFASVRGAELAGFGTVPGSVGEGRVWKRSNPPDTSHPGTSGGGRADGVWTVAAKQASAVTTRTASKGVPQLSITESPDRSRTTAPMVNRPPPGRT